MISKSCSNPMRLQPATKRCNRSATLSPAFTAIAFLVCFIGASRASAADAPAWMHALVNVPLPPHDEKTDAVLLYAEEITTVQADGKTKGMERRAYKILRPGGRGVGMVRVYYSGATKISNIHGWCIPAQGKDYEVKDKDAIETGPVDFENGELMSDLKVKLLKIPASEPGNIVGFEIEIQDRPYILQDRWDFQETMPVREARYTLQLPPGWEYKAKWINHAEIAPAQLGSNQWQWTVSDLPAIRPEDDMPPWRAVAGQMIISFLPSGGAQNKGFLSWSEMGQWETGLSAGRRDASVEIKQTIASLTANSGTPLAKMQALAQFLQKDIRYVAIELGIGGWQPHAATDVFTHRYGDCKDKATLFSSMLKEIGIDSYYVSINTRRGAVGPDTPPMMFWFNHEILAVKLPDALQDASLRAVIDHPKLGRLLIFDPTDEMTPFGHLRGALQSNYGLLVTPEGGDLVKLPQLPPSTNGHMRRASLTLDANGTLQGDITEQRMGDRAASQRYALKSVSKDADRIKPVESLLSHSLGQFQITKATALSLNRTDVPFGFEYSFVAPNYAKNAGGLLLVRPRVLGSQSSALLETKEPRKFPVEFDGPERTTDTFEIKLPAGYEVDDLPPPVNVDMGFASYHSKSEVSGNVLKYSRTFEVKELSVPLNKIDDLKKLYRIIASDERNTAVLKPASH